MPIVSIRSKIGKKLENLIVELVGESEVSGIEKFQGTNCKKRKMEKLKKLKYSKFPRIQKISNFCRPIDATRSTVSQCKIFPFSHRGWFLDLLDSFFFFSFFLYIPFSISVAGCRKLELKGCHVWDHTAARNSMWRISFESEKQSQLLFLSNRRILFLMVSNFKEGLEFWIFVVYKFETYGNSMFSSDIVCSTSSEVNDHVARYG